MHQYNPFASPYSPYSGTFVYNLAASLPAGLSAHHRFGPGDSMDHQQHQPGRNQPARTGDQPQQALEPAFDPVEHRRVGAGALPPPGKRAGWRSALKSCRIVPWKTNVVSPGRYWNIRPVITAAQDQPPFRAERWRLRLRAGRPATCRRPLRDGQERRIAGSLAARPQAWSARSPARFA